MTSLESTLQTPVEWFDVLAHTVTVDGDWPRCAECGEYGSHPEHQPEALVAAERAAAQPVARAGVAVARVGVDAEVSTQGGARSEGRISAPMVAALEAAWAAIRARHPEVPPVVIVLGGGSDGRPGTVKLGHFAALRWRTTPTPDTPDETAEDNGEGPQHGGAQPLGEVFVGGEGLARGPVDVLGTLLHEAAHALADVRGIKDTSRQGRWHNARFKALAEELGIEVTKDPKLGWSPTTVTDTARHDYAATVAELAGALRMQRAIDGIGFGLGTTSGSGDGGDPDSDGDGEEAGKRTASPACVCACRRRIRVAPTVLALGPIVCGVCEQPFTPDTGTDQPDNGQPEDDDRPGVDEGDVDEGDALAADGADDAPAGALGVAS